MRKQPTRAAAAPFNPAWSWPHAAIGLTILLASAFLIFARLGHYALWDDEAGTALSAIGVWRTGDTTAIIDHNIFAYESGKELRNLHLRYMPPLPSYLAAPFVGLLGNSSLAARLPFAIAGMICIALLVWWLYKAQASTLTCGLFGIAILGNVSLFLHFRQARYYSPAILFSAVLAYLYLHWDGRRRPLLVFSIFSLCLWTSNYLNYVALYACLTVDYLLWERKQRPLRWQDGLTLFLPQLVIGLPLVFIWNPFSAKDLHIEAYDSIADKMVLLWYNLRDMDFNERGASVLLLLLPAFYFATPKRWLLRGLVTLLTYILTITFITHHVAAKTTSGDMRFLAPLIPLCIFLGVTAVQVICCQKWWLGLPLAIVAFGTNVLQVYPYYFGDFHSTILLYSGELMNPPNDPYREASKWINANIEQGQTIWAMPFWTAYPLMYHAPKAIYAWQFSNPPDPQFQGLSPIHFKGVIPPDYIIAFGGVREVFGAMEDLKKLGVDYMGVEMLDIFARDLYGPELNWHAFQPITDFDRRSEAVYIFKRTSPPVLAANTPG